MALLSDSLVKKLLDGRYIASFATRTLIHVVAVPGICSMARAFISQPHRRAAKHGMQHPNPHVSLMIDSRDARSSRGTNIAGTAKILTGEL